MHYDLNSVISVLCAFLGFEIDLSDRYGPLGQIKYIKNIVEGVGVLSFTSSKSETLKYTKNALIKVPISAIKYVVMNNNFTFQPSV